MRNIAPPEEMPESPEIAAQSDILLLLQNILVLFAKTAAPLVPP